MNISDMIMMNIEDIHPYVKNPRNNDNSVDRVAESIAEFGFNQPIVIDKNGIIVVGHTRYKAAKQLGLTQVPVLKMPDEVNDAKIQAYRIADNKLNELAYWDKNLLLSELNDLTDKLDDLTIMGFSSEELDELFKDDDEWKLPDQQSYMSVFEIAIECADENEQEKLYIKLTEEGYKCRVLTI